MTNNSNIYDIDGNLIRSINDTHKWTVKECQDKIEEYRKKILEVGEKNPKSIVYATYMRNLSQYIMMLYANMTAEELNAEIEANKAKIATEEKVKEAIEELKKEVEAEEKPTVMDEYVQFEEINNDK